MREPPYTPVKWSQGEPKAGGPQKNRVEKRGARSSSPTREAPKLEEPHEGYKKTGPKDPGAQINHRGPPMPL